MPPFWGVTVHSGTTPHHGGDQKTEKVEVRQQHCSVRKIWKTGADPVRSQQKSTNLLRSHRLSSRGKNLWETPSRGRFAALFDGGRLFLNLFSNDHVGRAAQRLGVRAAFWNLRYGEGYDVTHLRTFDACSETCRWRDSGFCDVCVVHPLECSALLQPTTSFQRSAMGN